MGKKNAAPPAGCPVGRLLQDFDRTFGESSAFGTHLRNAQLEFLKAVRTFIDERIATMETPAPPKRSKRMTKVTID
jgi:hypothetical protein